MTKVSTHQPKSATPVTKSVSAAANAMTAVTISKADQQQLAQPEWCIAFAEARDKVTSLVQDLVDSEGSRRDNNSGRVDRLLGLVLSGFSRVQIDTQRLGPEYMQRTDVASQAYDAEAALFGAKSVLALELGSGTGHPNLEHALRIMGKLTEALSDGEVYPVWDAIRYTPKSATSVHAAEASAGFNAKQLELILETIAGNTQTLTQMLMLLQNNSIEDEFAQGVCIDAAKDLATAIGAMADDAIGGCVIGDAACWHFGRNFANTGKAVAA